MVIPAAYHSASVKCVKQPADLPNAVGSVLMCTDDDTKSGLVFISRGTALLLLLVYVGYLYFQVRRFFFLLNFI